jgi:hypothetical protein
MQQGVLLYKIPCSISVESISEARRRGILISGYSIFCMNFPYCVLFKNTTKIFYHQVENPGLSG